MTSTRSSAQSSARVPASLSHPRHGWPFVLAAGALTYFVVALYGAIGFVAYEKLIFQVLALAACTAGAWILHREACARAALVAFLICLICVWPPLQRTWPLPSVAVCSVFFFWWRPSWMKLHAFRGGDLGFAILSVALCGAGLCGWMLWQKPDVAGLAIMFPPWPWYVLVPLLTVFSAANAFAEEFLFRGLFYDALKVVSPTWLVITAQAAAFGLIHYRVFPFGWIGVGMGFAFGLMMGLLRWRSNSIWLSWLAHMLIDVGIGLLILVNI